MFLSGLIDGDGYISKSRASIEIELSCDKTIEAVEDIYNVLGVKYGIYNRKKKKSKNIYCKNKQGCKKIGSILSLKMDYKRERINNILCD